MVSGGCKIFFPPSWFSARRQRVPNKFVQLFFPRVQITHFDEITAPTLQMDDTEMSKELRCTASCHIHHLPLCDGASGPEWDGFWTCYRCHYSCKCYRISRRVSNGFIFSRLCYVLGPNAAVTHQLVLYVWMLKSLMNGSNVTFCNRTFKTFCKSILTD